MARTYTNTPEPRYVEKAKEAYTADNGLPEVTAEDNGKVLGVSSGAWTKITPESGAIPTITIDPSQIISVDPIIIQLAAEQVGIFNSDAPVINMDLIGAPVKLFTSSSLFPGVIVRSTVIGMYFNYKTSYMSAHIDSDDKIYIDMNEISEARYSLTYWLPIQRIGDEKKAYELAHEFVHGGSSAHMPQLRVDVSTTGTQNTLAFHCSSITPITDGYHCVFIHDEYDAQASKMAYTVFSFDIDSSYNVTNQSYDTHYAV